MSEKIERVKHAIERLLEKHGEVTTEGLLRYATPKASPIHDCFEWDDAVAAHQHRLATARRYLREVTIVHETREEKLVHVPRADERPGGAYKPISVVVRSADEFERAFNEAVRRVGAAQAAVAELREAAAEELGAQATRYLTSAERKLTAARSAILRSTEPS